MKNKLFLSLIAVFVFSCSTDSISEDTNTTNFEAIQLDSNLNPEFLNSKNTSDLTENPTNIDIRTLKEDDNLINNSFNDQTNSFGDDFPISNLLGLNCPGSPDPALYMSLTDPLALGFGVLEIDYNLVFSEEGPSQSTINCIRQEFFDHNRNLQLLVDNDGNRLTEIWVDTEAVIPFDPNELIPFSAGDDGVLTKDKAEADPRIRATERD